MARNSSWKGYLRISLVSLPVKAFSATATGGGQISLNQLHATCHSRIQYKKTCPIHGEVPHSEIVSGYEHSKGQYVVIDPDELQLLRTESDKSISVTKFVKSNEIDPLYFAGKDYFLLPDGPIGQKPYFLIHEAMEAERVSAIAQVVISRREELVVIRPMGRLLVMSALKYANEVKSPDAFLDELTEAKGNKQELQLTSQLIEALTEPNFDLSEYEDAYVEKLAKLIEAKATGKEIVATPAGEVPDVINLMDAIKQSMKQIKPAAETGKQRPKAESSKSGTPARHAGRRRKSG